MEQKLKHIKFNNQQINKLFDMLNSDSTITKIIGFTKGGISQLIPVDIEKSYVNPTQVKQLIKPGKRLNATVTVSAGHVYDDYGKSKTKTNEERTQQAIKKSNNLVARINDLLKMSNDDLYKSLEAELINKELALSRTYNDPYDDGDDWFGMTLYLSIHYAKPL